MKATCLLLLCYYIYFITAFQQRDTRFLRIFSIKANNDDEGWGNSKSYGFLPSGPDGLNDEDDKKSMLAKSSMGDKAFSFFTIMENTPPSEMILKFTRTAPKNVQEAAKSTILNLFGSIPNYALDAALITTSSKLANLLYQMQITGYMFKNAEYQMSMTSRLKGLPKLPSTIGNLGNLTFTDAANVDSSSVRGQAATVQTKEGKYVEVDVEELTRALSEEVLELREELEGIRDAREAELRSNLLTYIQALPENEILRLTSSMSDDVVQAIQMMVKTVMEKIGVSGTDEPMGEQMQEKVIQQSMSQLAQLCMWQMVAGYKLREYEALETGISLPKE